MKHIFVLSLLLYIVLNSSNYLLAQETSGESEEYLLFTNIEFDPTVIVASKREQQLTDAPAVVSVITARRIKELGAKSLMDVLRTIPGFNIVQDTNEHLTVHRGVFASTNQKFLIIKDGHTLNEPLFRAIELDYYISLDSIERIEIIRGPGSVIYGSAALTAVINIITKNGEAVDGTEVSVSAGNYGQKRASVLYGEKLGKADLLMHASWYDSEGETINQSADLDLASPTTSGSQLVDKYPSNYDLGLKFTNGDFVLSASLRQSEYVPPRANNGGLYDENSQIRDVNQVWNLGYVDLNYHSTINESATIRLTHYIDWEHWYSNQLMAPRRQISPDGRWLYMDFSLVQYGLDYMLTYVIDDSTVDIGIRASNWKILDDSYIHNITDPETFIESNHLLTGPEKEYYYALYMQYDRDICDWLTVDVGASYDEYELSDSSVNPRIAFITKPAKNLTWKILYGKSFLNPSYFYRYISPDAYGYFGGTSLKPEKMESYQTHLFYQIPEKALFEISYFYNKLTDLIGPAPNSITQTYSNYGESTIWGIEPEIKVYLNKNLSCFVNATYQKPITDKTTDSLLTNSTITSIPKWTGNVGITALFSQLSIDVLVNWHGTIEKPDANRPNYQIPETAIVDLNLEWDVMQIDNLTIGFNIHNLFDKKDISGGTIPIAFPEKGRWVLLTVTKKI